MKYQIYQGNTKCRIEGFVPYMIAESHPSVWEQNVDWFDNNFEIEAFVPYVSNGEHRVGIQFTRLTEEMAETVSGCIRTAFCRHIPGNANHGLEIKKDKGYTRESATLVPNSLFNDPHRHSGKQTNTLTNIKNVTTITLTKQELMNGKADFSIEYIYTGINHSKKPSWYGHFGGVVEGGGEFYDYWAIGLIGSDKGNYRLGTRFWTREIDVLRE